VALGATFALVLGVGLFAAAGQSARAVPSLMTWTDAGVRNQQTGTFTAAAPLCPSGTYKDIEATVGVKSVHTCADGSGTFDFETSGINKWSFSGGGTGRYVTLRGSGPCHVTFNDNGTVTRTCSAYADFDNTAPSAGIERPRLTRAGRAYKLALSFKTADNVAGNAVSWKVDAVAAGRRVGRKVGRTNGGTVSIALTVRPPKRARRLAISLRVADPLDNARTVSRSSRLPR
jgi:hypothetical protein